MINDIRKQAANSSSRRCSSSISGLLMPLSCKHNPYFVSLFEHRQYVIMMIINIYRTKRLWAEPLKTFFIFRNKIDSFLGLNTEKERKLKCLAFGDSCRCFLSHQNYERIMCRAASGERIIIK